MTDAQWTLKIAALRLRQAARVLKLSTNPVAAEEFAAAADRVFCAIHALPPEERRVGGELFALADLAALLTGTALGLAAKLEKVPGQAVPFLPVK